MRMTDSNQCQITLTDRAQRHLTKMIHNQSGIGVLVALEKAGCAGYMYRIEIIQSPPEDCVEIAIDQQVTLFVPFNSVPRLNGSQLDYQMNQLETKAVFKNPNVTLACGCGDSVELIQTEGSA